MMVNDPKKYISEDFEVDGDGFIPEDRTPEGGEENNEQDED